MSVDEHDFLDDIAPSEADQETPETPEPVTASPEAEKVENVEPETAEPEVPTTPEVKEEKTVPYAAMKAEREKRQRLERELEEARKAAPQEPVPTFYEAPEQYLKAVESRSNERLYLALEAQAREQYADYDEVFEAVKEHAAGNPAVAQEILAAPNPALAAYKLGKKLREFERMQDPDAYRQQIEAEVRAKVEAEYKSKDEARTKAAAAIPPDLTESRSAKGNDLPASGSVFDEIF